MSGKQFTSRPLDQATIAAGYQGPGMDTRQWCSYGIVTAGGDPQDIIDFDEDEGMPLVSVILEPSKVPVRCRVGSMCAGNGEGEWNPFVQGDEVMVLIPEGDERAGCVIICRLNNSIDRFPFESVAGQDPKTNTFGFRRSRTPFINEYAGPIMLRSALNQAFLSIDTEGVVMIRDGQNAAFQMSPDLIGFQGPSTDTSPPRFICQADLTGERFTVQFGNSLLQMNSESADQNAGETWVISPNRLYCKQGLSSPTEHVATVEFVLAVMSMVIPSLVPAGPAVWTAFEQLLRTGVTAMLPTTSSALATGFTLASQTPKPPPIGGVQIAPGLGAINFLTA